MTIFHSEVGNRLNLGRYAEGHSRDDLGSKNLAAAILVRAYLDSLPEYCGRSNITPVIKGSAIAFFLEEDTDRPFSFHWIVRLLGLKKDTALNLAHRAIYNIPPPDDTTPRSRFSRSKRKSVSGKRYKPRKPKISFRERAKLRSSSV